MATLNVYSEAADIQDNIDTCQRVMRDVEKKYPHSYRSIARWRKYNRLYWSFKKQLEEIKDNSPAWMFGL